MSYQGHQVRVGADIGGTFTDVVLEAGPQQYSTKVLTNYSEPEQAIIDGLIKITEKAGIGLEHVDQLIHGTIKINCVCTTLFIITKGIHLLKVVETNHISFTMSTRSTKPYRPEYSRQEVGVIIH